MNQAQDVFYLPLENAVSDDFSLGFEPKPVPPSPISAVPSPAQLKAVPVAAPAAVAAPGDISGYLNQLAALVANVTEAYTVAVFLADHAEQTLQVAGLHTLSRDFINEARIGFGCGLIGWTAEHAVRISVCPFEHDARTLLCYSKDQDLKSFIAVPILDSKEKLLGVISCDSKKNYAFAKVTEKILLDCAAQAAVLITLAKKAGVRSEQPQKPEKDLLQTTLDSLIAKEDEESLLQAVTEIPGELVKRDAFVVVTTAEWGVGPGKFYSSVAENRIGHRLLEMVCKHKKIICGDRSVHALPVDDTKHRSFLSVPFRVLGREAGSFNLLSRPHEAFSAAQIAALEEIAKNVGRELERIRLREKFATSMPNSETMSWKHFSIAAKSLLADAQAQRTPLSLLRVHFRTLLEIEEFAGIEAAASIISQVMRLAEQTTRAPALCCSIYGPQLLILSEASEGERIIMRLRRLIERINTADHMKDARGTNVKLGAMVNKGLEVVSVRFPIDGTTLAELIAKSRAVLETAAKKQTTGVAANAGNW